MSNSPQNSEQQSSSTPPHIINESKPESLNSLIEAIGKNVEPIRLLISELAEKWLKIKESEFEFNKKMIESELEFNKRMVYSVVLIVVLIIISASILTFYNKIEGSTFTFLLGLIMGYILTFIKEIAFPKGNE